ncbi:winged helix-turn-helix transcriptional regulator [Methanonatronarchaeum sp. AMET-Sl]|uniref:Lrp/AsnC family transcriptional regulator n=1 Tax=Methanonatronarchaeum sp. AMET-Sl TaxID=3037654 RepID=UPI00244DEA0E|nr:winged helix-turn-helix transcriptional regulator [Methanonatronarchaeum sp. AMET-Sl]WGI17755.1 winged helix-turn-helix transcriptional regulator [Methanonatronarchaeum sp. AMET-Sl]
MGLDTLQKQILNELYEGRSSYSEIGEKLDISQTTVYRKIKEMEEEGYIQKNRAILPNYNKLDISVVALGISLKDIESEDKVIDILKNDEYSNILFRGYLEHSIISILFCEEGKAGKAVKKIKNEFRQNNINPETVDITISTAIEKIDMLPNLSKTL